MQARRVWTNKKTCWNNKQAVWEVDGELKVYWPRWWEDVNGDLNVYDQGWKEVSEDAELDVYDSSRPTEIGTSEDGLKAKATFMNGETKLQEVTVKDWETPEYTGDTPTKEADEENTYEFDGWTPKLKPIYKDTTFEAKFKATPKASEE